MKNIFTLILSVLLFASPCKIFMSSVSAQGWQWGRVGSGAGCDAYAVATDPTGNVFGAGWLFTNAIADFGGGVTIPAYPGASFPTYRSMWVKYDNTGVPLWAGATDTGNTNLNNICTDPSGNLIVYGAFSSAFMTLGSYHLTNSYGSGYGQYFLAKISPTGTVLWAIKDGNTVPSYLSILGSYILTPGGVATDAAGNIYITSGFKQASMSIGSTTLTNTSTTGATYDIYVAKYDPSGTPIWASAVGGAGNDYGFGITVATTGYVYVTGVFNSLSMTVGGSTISNPFSIVSTTGADTPIAYIAKFNATTGAPVWAQQAGETGGTRGAFGVGLAHDNAGNVYMTGGFCNPTITFGSTTLTRPHPSATGNRTSLYLVQYTPSDAVSWNKVISSDATNVFGYSIALASCGQVWVSGNYSSPAYIDADTLVVPGGSGGDPIFIAGYNLTGGVVGYAGLRSGGDDQNGIACDASGNVFMCSDLIGTMTVGPDVISASAGASEAFFVAKYANSIAVPDTIATRHDTVMCDIGGITLTAPSGYSSYYWDDGSGDTLRTITATGTYWVYGTTCGVDVALDSFVVNFSPSDTTYMRTDTSACANLASVTLGSPGGYPSHLWSTGATTSTISVTTGGSYILTAYGGCNLLVDTFNLTLTPVDTSINNIDTSVCSSTTSIMLTAPTGYTAYRWSSGSTATFITVSASGTYWMRATAGCNMLIDTFDVTFLPIPTVALGPDTAFCVGHTLTLSSPQPPGSTYAWSTGSSASSIVVSTSGVYSLTVTYANGCSTTDSRDVTISPYPIVDLGPDTAICDGTSPVLMSSVTYPTGSTYLWNTGSTASSIVVSTLGVYWLNVTVAGCSFADTMEVKNIWDTLHFEMIDTAICLGDPPIKVRATGTPGMTYQWLPTTGIGSSTIVDPYINADTSALYTIRASISTCPDILKSFYIDVQPKPTVDIGGKQGVCSNDSLHLHALVSPRWYTNYIYRWTPGANLHDSTQSSVIFTPGSDMKMTLIVTTPAGCMGMDSVLLKVYTGDFAQLDAQFHVCPHESVTLEPKSTDPKTTYVWHPGRYLNDSTVANPIVTPITPQDYYAIATNSYGCKDTIHANVDVSANGVIEVGDSVTIFPGESYEIPTKTNCVTFNWFPPSGLDNAKVAAPVASPQISTRYIVQAVTQWGCKITDTLSIYVDNESTIAVPNAFTPGGASGPNNTFKLVKKGQATLQSFRIFNRWGNVVFETSDIDEGWDGSYKGKPQPFGVYVYQVEATTRSGVPFKKKGNVTLIR